MTRLALLTLIASACADEEPADFPDLGDTPWEAGALPAERVGPPPVLSQTEVVPGSQTTFTVTGAPAGAQITLLYSTTGIGVGPCHPVIAVCTDLLAPAMLAQGNADGAGTAVFNVGIPTIAPLATLYTQAVSIDAGAGDASNTVTAPILPSHAVHIQPIWDATCLGNCHAPPMASDGLDLSGDAYDDLVGVPSSDVPTMDRVTPYDSANSYLWHKLEGTQAQVGGAGSQMPKGAATLTAAELALIEDWINGGAFP